jgi:hypothetical protein
MLKFNVKTCLNQSVNLRNNFYVIDNECIKLNVDRLGNISI